MLRHCVLAIGAALSVLVAGCATTGRIQSDVVVFHQMTGVVGPEATFAVLPWRKEKEGSLEFAAYAQLVAAQLRSKGFTVVEQGKSARYAVFVDYGIDDGRRETVTYDIPLWGVTGYGSATTYGTATTYGSTTTLNATTIANPTYGVTGYAPVTNSYTVYRRFVSVDVVDVSDASGKPKKVYEGRLKSEGSCGNLVTLMPVFTENLLADFPGQPGRSGRVETPWDGRC